MNDGRVSATFHVDSAQAGALMERQLASLRDALETRGLQVVALSVRTTEQDSTPRRAEAQPAFPRTPDATRPSAGTPLANTIDADRRGGANTGSGASRDQTRDGPGTKPSSGATADGSRSGPVPPGGAPQLAALRLDAIA